jgi:hypothetical protein
MMPHVVQSHLRLAFIKMHLPPNIWDCLVAKAVVRRSTTHGTRGYNVCLSSSWRYMLGNCGFCLPALSMFGAI